MAEVTRYESGMPSWVDLSTPDAPDAIRFYCGLLGWEKEDIRGGGGVAYTMCKIRGKNVAGIYQQDSSQSRVAPPNWTTYITVDDIDQSTGKAASAGGNVIMEPFSVTAEGQPEDGKASLIQDPTGATFVMWQPAGHIGAQLISEPGCYTWSELITDDPETAEAFYSDVFGWKGDRTEMAGVPYTAFMLEGALAAGMLQKRAEWVGSPNQWADYFAVDDIGTCLKRMTELGGDVISETLEIPLGRFALGRDPQGALFYVIQLNPMS